MDVTLRSAPDRVRLTLWLLPAAFVGHDLEELLTAPRWLVAHHAELGALAARNELFSVLLRNLARTQGAFSVAVGVVFLIFLGVTLAATIGPRGATALRAYLAVLGAFTLHAFAHVGQAILFRGYVPGLFGSVLLVFPAGVVVYRALFRARLVSVTEVVACAAIGAAMFLPTLMIAHVLGHLIFEP